MARPLGRTRTPRGQHLAELRRAAGLSQVALAAALEEPQSTIARWEVGEHTPRADMLPKLARALGCSIEDLLNVSPGKAVRPRGPTGKAKLLFEQVARLPKSQQDRVLQMVSIFLEQARRAE